MADFVKLVESMKVAALDAVDASKPVEIVFGTVVSVSPLKINVEQKMLLEEPQLVLARNVTDYYIDMTVQHATEREADHFHEYKDKKRFLVHNALKNDERVLMLRMQGGQKYAIIDRLEGSPDVTSGQWIS